MLPKRFINWWNQYIDSLDDFSNPDEFKYKLREPVFYIFSLIGIISLVTFVPYYLIAGDLFKGLFELVILFVTVFNLSMYALFKNIKLSSSLLLLLMSVLSLFLLVGGGIEGTGVLWLYTFPILAFMLHSPKNGIWWMVFFLSSLISISIISQFLQIDLHFSQIFMRQLIITLIVVSAMVYFYAYLMEKSVEKITEIVMDNRKFKMAVENASEQIVITDKEGTVLYANPITETITGYKTEEALGTKAGVLWGKIMDHDYYVKMWQTIKDDKEVYDNEIINKRKNGEKYAAKITISPVLDDEGEVKFFVAIQKDVTEEREADQIKSDFVSLASHQLRTPLSAARWMLELIKEEKSKTMTQHKKELLDDVYNSILRMIGLVNSLLNLSRVESGSKKTIPKKFSISNAVSVVLKELQLKIADKKLKVKLTAEDGADEVLQDQDVVSEILAILLNNAVDYSLKDGEIKVRISKKEKNHFIDVIDQGIGIKTEDQEQIFHRFFRSEKAFTKQTQGFGLSLYMARLLARNLGGDITFVSTEGQGSTFTLIVPIMSGPKS